MYLVRKNWMTNNRNRKWRSQKSDGYYDCAISLNCVTERVPKHYGNNVEKSYHLPWDLMENGDNLRFLRGPVSDLLPGSIPSSASFRRRHRRELPEG